MRLLLLASLALALGACRGAAPVDVMGSGPGSEDDWQCLPAPDGGWACMQEPDAAASEPSPPALPSPLPTPEAPPAELGKARPSAPSRPARVRPQLPPTPAAQPPAPTEPADLARAPANHYAVQLIALGSEAALDAFVAERQLGHMMRVRVASGGRLHYALLAGIYPSRQEANQAVAALAPALRALKPWVRAVGGLQAAMAEADARVPAGG